MLHFCVAKPYDEFHSMFHFISNSLRLWRFLAFYTHHDWEDDGEEGWFEDPEDSQTDQLDEGEQVDPAQRHMP